MNIALIGYGKMGKIIEELAREQGHSVNVIIDPIAEISRFGIKVDKDIHKSEKLSLGNVDVAIEFTQPDKAFDNITSLAEKKIPAVTGTTGWYDRMDDVKKVLEDSQSSLLWASNFSIGVNLFYRIAWYAAELFDKFPQFDVGGFEAHHSKKLDSPSGTAKTLAEGTLSRIQRKKKIVWDALAKRRPEDDELHFPSLRMGSIPGQHSLFFDSPADTVEITHTARNREGFALGAIKAAEWLISAQTHNKGQRLFVIDDMLEDVLK